MFFGLPPGSTLCLLYLRDRLKKIPPGQFIEIGPGSGEISKLLLMLGWTGIGIDLQPKSVLHLEKVLSTPIANGKFSAINGDFNKITLQKVDLIISNQVMEHLSKEQEVIFLQRSLQLLKPNGKFIAIVPAAMKYWSIEDDVVGHHRRYERGYMENNLKSIGLKLDHVAGITFPVSNILFPISSHLIAKHESYKLKKSMQEQTVLSGIRQVPFKTHFPRWLNIALNSYSLYPLHLLQKIFSKNPNAMNLFYEASIE